MFRYPADYISLGFYGLELVYAVNLIKEPSQVGYVYNLIFLLLGVFSLGLVRAWELLGAHRYGFFGWLSPLHTMNDSEVFSPEGNAYAAPGQAKTDEAAPHSPQ